MPNNIESRLVKILKENIPTLDGDVQQVLKNDLRNLKINSLNFIKIIVAIEDEFNIEFDDNQFNQEFFGQVQNLAGLISEKVQAHGK